MIKEEIERLRYLAKRMPEGEYTYYRKFDALYAETPSSSKMVIEVYDETKGEYWALLSPENVNWLLDKAEEALMNEDDLK